MKISLNKCWLKAGLAGLILTASAGVSYAQIQINFPANNAGWSAATDQGVIPFSFTSDAPGGGPSTGSVLWGNGNANFQQLYFKTASGGLGGTIDATPYTQLEMDVKPVGGSIDSWQVVVQSTVNGWMPASVSPSLPDTGWQHIVIQSSQGIDGGNKAVNWASIYSIGFGFWDGSMSQQAELSNIKFSVVPEPSSWALFGFGVVALGLTTCYRRKLVS
jgi:hypothetical protein